MRIYENEADVLNDAIDILRVKGWNRGGFAMNKDGEECNTKDPDAVSFCLLGSIYAQDSSRLLTMRALDAVRRALGVDTIDFLADWNDYTAKDKEQVIELLQKACRSIQRSDGDVNV